MNRTYYFLAVLLFTMVAGLNSCKLPDKPDTYPIDEKAPVVTIVSPTPVEPAGFMANTYGELDSMGIEVIFEDNMELMEYEIRIFYNGDLYFLKTNADPIDKTLIGTLSGTDKTIQIPVTIDYDPYVGPYVIEVLCRDKAGHETVARTYIMVTNKGDALKPTFTVTKPSIAVTDTFRIGEYIQVKTTINDNSKLVNAMVRVRNIYTREMLPDSEYWYQIPGVSSYTIDQQIYVGPVAPGNYEVELYARDTIQNLGTKIIPIYIKPNHL
ncbi:MAG: hypothetical protein H6581_24600 [Bacteroidia bacterium]|nr:hypothetical protein [Bacteroidia bacterium]